MSNKKVGRPKSETAKRYEGRINSLEQKIEELETVIEMFKDNPVRALPDELCTAVGVGLDYDSKKKQYNIRIIKYNPLSPKLAKIVDTRKGGDSGARAMYELKKVLSHEIDVITQNN